MVQEVMPFKGISFLELDQAALMFIGAIIFVQIW